MRIAVVITGEPRYHVETTPRLRDMIVQPLRLVGHQVDVLLCLWDSRLPPGQIANRQNHTVVQDGSARIKKPEEHVLINRIMRPKLALYLDKPQFNAGQYVSATRQGTNTWGMMCQHKSWNLAAQQVQICEELYGYQYDCIIRLRLDAHFHHEILLPLPMDSVYVPECEGHTNKNFNPAHMCNDQIALGPRILMLQFLRLIQHYPEFARANFPLTPETVVHYHLQHVLQCGFKTFPLKYHLQR
jgi:hypothetical protein